MLRTSVLSVVIGIVSLQTALSQPQQPGAGDSQSFQASSSNTRDVTLLRQISSAFQQIAQRSGQAVVQIFARSYLPQASGGNDPILTAENSTASGVVLSADGYILTNAHVVRGAHNIRVHIQNGDSRDANSLSRTLPAALVGVDAETDLAVVKINEVRLPYLAFANSDEVEQGQLVLALGNPLGLESSVSLGVVSSPARQLKPDDLMTYIQTDAPVNPGNSGGPLLDADGNVIGINTFILSQWGGSEGVAFAIPSNIARQVFEQLKTQGRVHRAEIGFVGQTIDSVMATGLNLQTDTGIMVSDLEPDSAAEQAGLKRDDIIIAINNHKVSNLHQLETRIFRQVPGTVLGLSVLRGEQHLDISVRTIEQSDELQPLAETLDPEENAIHQLGILGVDISKTVLQLMPDLRRPSGVLVALRDMDERFLGPTLEVGDAIYEVNRQVISSVRELRSALDVLKPGDAAVLLVERQGHLIYLPLEAN